MTIYFNTRTAKGVETVDQFTRGEDAPQNFKEFRAYIKSMLDNYSQRSNLQSRDTD